MNFKIPNPDTHPTRYSAEWSLPHTLDILTFVDSLQNSKQLCQF